MNQEQEPSPVISDGFGANVELARMEKDKWYKFKLGNQELVVMFSKDSQYIFIDKVENTFYKNNQSNTKDRNCLS